MEYHLYPPFFNINGEDFDDAWEILCCRLLNLKHRTHEISRIKAPDESRDLYWEAKRIAYQCKAVRLGSKLNLTEVKKQLKGLKRSKQK